MLFPLASVVLLLVALVFLILACVSLPVTTALKVGQVGDFTFGIFGYCKGSVCPSGLYPVLFGGLASDERWLFGESTRNTLAKTFIVAPIAAGLTFLALVLSAISVFFDHSVVVMLSIAFAVLLFVSSALIAVMVILVFQPHVAWAGWILVGAAACALISVPLLLLGIRVHHTDDSDTESAERIFTLADLSEKLDFEKPFVGGPRIPDSLVNLFKELDVELSLYSAQPKHMNDITKNDYVVNDGPSTPVLAKKQMAPSVVPNVATLGSLGQNQGPNRSINSSTSRPYYQSLGYNVVEPTDPPRQPGPHSLSSPHTLSTPRFQSGPQSGPHSNPHSASQAPYPKSFENPQDDVFRHHPEAEGHKPFTELDENDSPALLHPNFSDDGSDFTSVSQRPPNVKPGSVAYLPQSQRGHPNYAPGFQPQLMPNYQNTQYQAYLNQYQYQNQGQYPQYQPQQYQNAQYQNAQYLNQGQYLNQYQSPQLGPPKPKKTISDNVLNNNPDFALGGVGPKRKQLGAPKPGRRDGPYGVSF